MGEFVGAIVGNFVGAFVGVFVGRLVGAIVGGLVLVFVGGKVGGRDSRGGTICCFGYVGAKVGRLVGIDVGALVGLAVLLTGILDMIINELSSFGPLRVKVGEDVTLSTDAADGAVVSETVGSGVGAFVGCGFGSRQIQGSTQKSVLVVEMPEHPGIVIWFGFSR